jgi:hypothetical protein
MDHPGNTDSEKVLKEENQLKDIQAQVNQLYRQYNELESTVKKLESAVEAHPETEYDKSSEPSLYRADRKPETEIEIDIAVLTGLSSQKWRNIEKLFEEVNQGLRRYRDELEDNPLQEYNIVNNTRQKIRKELRETETRLEDLSVETYQLLGEQPSPESETVLKPNSAQPIASD